MSVYVTSDQHFNHNNILTFEPKSRPFKTVDEMNETLIDNWNSVVQSDDTVWQLGDFVMGLADTVNDILPKLNGRIIIVLGNHDTHSKIKKYLDCGVIVTPDYYAIAVDNSSGKKIIMCHYPRNMIKEDTDSYGSILNGHADDYLWLYGHIHSAAPHGYNQNDNSYHVGVDTNNLTPVLLDDVLKSIK